MSQHSQRNDEVVRARPPYRLQHLAQLKSHSRGQNGMAANLKEVVVRVDRAPCNKIVPML